MRRLAVVIAAVLCSCAVCAPAAPAAEPPTGWDGVNPFNCELQYAGFNGVGPHPEADPYCIEFDKRRQNVTQFGVVDFMLLEPARVAAASPKCFYFQSDHWRGSLVQNDPATKTYEWDGHYFFDKAKGEGGVWVSNFNFNGQTGNPAELPGMPPEYAQHFGPGTGGFRSRNGFEADPVCAERARREGSRIYRSAGGATSTRCMTPGGRVHTRRLGPVHIGDDETTVRRRLGPPESVRRGFLRFCVAGGGRFVVGQREDRSGDLGEGAEEKTVMILSTSSAFRHKRVGPGSSRRTMRRRLRHSRRLTSYGKTRVYMARPRSKVLFGVRGGRVTFIAVRNRDSIKGRKSVSSFVGRSG